MKKYTYLLIAAAILAMIWITGSKSDYLVRHGKTDWVIQTGNSADPQILRSAELIQTCILKMSGTELPLDTANASSGVLILSVNSGLHPDGFQIKTSKDRVEISGGDHKGCIYGAVIFLEALGCQKYSPNFEIVPVVKKIRIPELDLEDAPVNSYRNVNGRFTMDPDYQDWMALDIIDDIFAKGYYVHTFNRLVPWQVYFETNPDYFAWMNGKRIIDQLCPSHPEVLNITLAKLEEDMRLQPDKLVWSVSQNDNFSFCQCENCSRIIEEEGSPAGPIIHFVNEIARHFPDRIISTLAYQYSRQAPKVTRPEPNVQIMLCTIELNRSQPIAEDERSRSFLQDMEDWGKIASHIYLWDYTVNFSHHVTPFPNYHVLQPNLQLFTNNGVHYHFQQSNTDTGHEFSQLKAWLLAHLLWNPDADTEELTDRFMKGYYGRAARHIRKYFDALHDEILKTGEWLDIYGHPTAHEQTFLSAENIDHYLRIFDRALASVASDSARLILVREALLPVQYAAMEIAKNHMFDERGWFTTEPVYEIRPRMLEMLEMFIETCRQAGVNTLSEAGLKPEDYYQATLRTLDIRVEKNRAFRKAVAASPSASAKYGGGDLNYLTNGVKGSNDFKVHWLGWEAQDFTLDIDLGDLGTAPTVAIGSLYDPKSWIFHPLSVECLISSDGRDFSPLGSQLLEGDQQNEPVTRTWSFDTNGKDFRYLRFNIRGTLKNPDWHPSAGGASWVFVDEVWVNDGEEKAIGETR